jgi:hypothetical protein
MRWAGFALAKNWTNGRRRARLVAMFTGAAGTGDDSNSQQSWYKYGTRPQLVSSGTRGCRRRVRIDRVDGKVIGNQPCVCIVEVASQVGRTTTVRSASLPSLTPRKKTLGGKKRGDSCTFIVRVEYKVVHLLPLSLQARLHLGANFLCDISRPVGA